MLEVKIPQEIRKYEAKMVGPFTTRQAICVVCAALAGWLLFTAFRTSITKAVLIGIIMAVGFPAGLIGWWKPYGMPFEKFFVKILFSTLLSPAKRYFKSGETLKEIAKAEHEIAEAELTITPDMTKEEKKRIQRAKAKAKANVNKIRKKYAKEIAA